MSDFPNKAAEAPKMQSEVPNFSDKEKFPDSEIMKLVAVIDNLKENNKGLFMAISGEYKSALETEAKNRGILQSE
jgi:hypothetical protein